MFAFDSIPAALAISNNFFAIFTSNIFAVLGLRTLYFAVNAVVNKFELMQQVIGTLLIFIGVKVVYDWIAENYHLTTISPSLSLGITLTILLGGFIISMVYQWRKA